MEGMEKEYEGHGPIWRRVPLILLVAGSIYIPFCRAPELTSAQLVRSYWWFYIPLFAFIAFRLAWRRRREE